MRLKKTRRRIMTSVTKTKETSKTWEVTLNNYTDDDIALFTRWSEEVSRILIAKEVGEQGTPHLQGRIVFKRAYRLAGLKKLHPAVHWEMTLARSDWLYAQKKGSEVIIDVNNSKQGQRNDWENLKKDLVEGISETELWKEHTSLMIRYSKGIITAKQKLNPKSDKSKFTLDDFKSWTPITDWSKSHVIVGAPNIGKTEFAKAHFENPLLISHIDELDNFVPEFHDGLIFDDMDFKHLPVNSQKHLTDIDNDRAIHKRYTCVTIPKNTKKIFTCNEDAIPFNLLDSAVERRVTVTKVSPR